ncbi:MAG: addiction module protein [Verrucomicrobia bacterium]|nr:addiction module protein [Verrucomicrobiota bacterium]
MPKALAEVTKDALELAPRQRLAFEEFLLESAEAAAAHPEAEAAWDAEIRDRIRAIDEGRVAGIAYEDVMRAAERCSVPSLSALRMKHRASSSMPSCGGLA